MAKKKSNNPFFTVAETVGKAAEGEDSLLSLNNQIQAATDTSQIFIPMKRICAAMAISKKITTPGICKIRKGGSPDDFLNYCVMNYVDRWKKQFEPPHGKKPVAHIYNWLPYINNTIRYCLINYNMEIENFDFLPLPNHFTDSTNGETEEDDIPYEDFGMNKILLRSSLTRKTIHDTITALPEEFTPYLPDILYYIRSRKTKYISPVHKNYIIIGANLFMEELRRWII